MPKRKSNPSVPATPLSLTSFDAALDLLACETFARLDSISAKFEQAAGFALDEGAVRARWEDAVKRYWVMKSMDDLCCSFGAGPSSGSGSGRRKAGRAGEQGEAGAEAEADGEMGVDEGKAGESGMEGGQEVDEHGRVVARPHRGAVELHGLNGEEEQEWRRWGPKVGDVVLVDTPEDGWWPGKIIDRRPFFNGRSQPKGSHFFPVRIYNPDMEPTLTIKSRLLPLSIRPSAPLLAHPALLSAYNHAAAPDGFDADAHVRECAAADRRLHPGHGAQQPPHSVSGQGQASPHTQLKEAKASWNAFVNWVMNERRAEKLRNLAEEREKRVRLLAANECRDVYGSAAAAALGEKGEDERGCGTGGEERKKRRMSLPLPPVSGEHDSPNGFRTLNGSSDASGHDRSRSAPRWTGLGIFGANPALPIANGSANSSIHNSPVGTPSRSSQGIFGSAIRAEPAQHATPTPRRTSSPFLARPLGTTPTRPLSPRRLEKRRGTAWTPPRILPSGDETAPFRRFGPDGQPVAASGTGLGPGAPSGQFDFVSPLGAVRSGTLAPPGGTHMQQLDDAGRGASAAAQMSGSRLGMTGLGNAGASASSSPLGHTTSAPNLTRRRSDAGLEVVREVQEEEEEGWTIVRKGRAGPGSGSGSGSGPGPGRASGHTSTRSQSGADGMIGRNDGRRERGESAPPPPLRPPAPRVASAPVFAPQLALGLVEGGAEAGAGEEAGMDCDGATPAPTPRSFPKLAPVGAYGHVNGHGVGHGHGHGHGKGEVSWGGGTVGAIGEVSATGPMPRLPPLGGVGHAVRSGTGLGTGTGAGTGGASLGVDVDLDEEL